jgi:hypothetical protein
VAAKVVQLDSEDEGSPLVASLKRELAVLLHCACDCDYVAR